jgi:hypothetical protein
MTPSSPVARQPLHLSAPRICVARCVTTAPARNAASTIAVSARICCVAPLRSNSAIRSAVKRSSTESASAEEVCG